MTQPIGGMPPNFMNLVNMPTVAYHMHGGHLHKIDPFVSGVAQDVFGGIVVSPVSPIQDPSSGDSGESREEGVPITGAPGKPVVEEDEGRRFVPPFPKVTGKEIQLDVSFRPKLEGDFKEIFLKVAEKILPPQTGKESEKTVQVEKVAEAIENEFTKVVQDLVKNLGESALSSLKMIPKTQQNNNPEAMSMIKGDQQGLVVAIKLPADLTPKGGQVDSKLTGALLEVTIALAKGSQQQITPESLSQQTVISPQQIPQNSQSDGGKENLLLLANTTLIPLQLTLTKESVQAMMQIHGKVNPETEHILHHHHHHHRANNDGGFDALSVPSITSSSDLQGLTAALTLPLGLIPVLPPHVINQLDLLKHGHLKKDESAVGSIAHKSLQHEKLPPATSDNTPIQIPSDKPNLHRIPDGREISYLLQMAQMGVHGEKKVTDSAFRLPDGLKLDPGYRLGDLLVISYLAALCGASSLTQIGAFVDEHKEWLESHFDTRRGVPSPTVFMWLFARITPYFFTKIILQHIECITDRKHGRRSPFNEIRIWETDQGILFGQSKTESKGPSQSQIIRLFDWEDATLILEPVNDPAEILRHVSCRLLMSVDATTRDRVLENLQPITSKSQEWNDALDVVSSLELTLYPNWTHGQYKRVQEGILKINRSFLSNLPVDFNAWNTMFYNRTDIEEQTAWVGEGRFLSFGEVTISHAIDNFEQLQKIAYKTVLSATTLSGSVEQKRLKFWEDPDELLILIGY